MVSVCRARVIATYMTRRSSAFSKGSGSGETSERSGSSTISEGKPDRPLSARRRITWSASKPFDEWIVL